MKTERAVALAEKVRVAFPEEELEIADIGDSDWPIFDFLAGEITAAERRGIVKGMQGAAEIVAPYDVEDCCVHKVRAAAEKIEKEQE